MNSLWQAPVVVMALLTWLNATPSSLADAAQREALRRQLTPKPTRQLTNFSLPPSAFVPMPENDSKTADQGAAADGAAAKDGAKAAAKDTTTPAADDNKHDESWWRNRLASAKRQLQDDQNLATALQSRISSLTADFTSRDDPAQRAKIEGDRKNALDQLARMQKQIDDDQKAIDEVRDDARKANVPAGWVR